MIGRYVIYHHECCAASSLALVHRVHENESCELVVYHEKRFMFLDHIEQGAGPNHWSLRQEDHRGYGQGHSRRHVHGRVGIAGHAR
jgi:hypothetical protein